ncbi:MAG: coproporphyrinogen dehydrogenase HemZ [Clostridia bacterium]|nr:coproporphyrinogen dehydrogenase HemZ [Clostridia bacterium]
MILTTVNHDFRYELEKLCRIFLPFEKIEIIDTLAEGNAYANTVCERGEEKTRLYAALSLFGKTREYETEIENNSPDYTADCEREIATCLYHCFCDITGYTPPWGILTGVRPAKLYSRLASANGGEDAEQYFKEKLLVSDEKISLCRETNASEEKIVSLSAPESFSLYISIPFCPTRCSYCSFVSHSVEHAKKLIPEYVKLLCEELKITAGYAARNHLRLETIYMGGGTPTTLTAEQMDTVLSVVRENFDLSNLREFTVEAGRPDTITREKLEVIKKNGVDRISINPQTMNDSVLSAIGRRHTAEETEKAFYLARECGFDNINMDLIAGLPTDTEDSFSATLDRVLALSPESITVHSLALKRAATLSTEGELPEKTVGDMAKNMVSAARSRISAAGIAPYYMYRQSKTVGNLENVGYSLPGKECLYNVYIMDETHTILACGASAVTKLKEPCGNFIERIFNYKYPYEYINRFGELMERKARIDSFYETYRK